MPKSKEDTRDLETKLRQDLGLLEWQIRDILPLLEAHTVTVAAEAAENAIRELSNRTAMAAGEMISKNSAALNTTPAKEGE